MPSDSNIDFNKLHQYFKNRKTHIEETLDPLIPKHPAPDEINSYISESYKVFDFRMAKLPDETETTNLESPKVEIKKKQKVNEDFYFVPLNIKFNEFFLNELVYEKCDQNIVLAIPRKLLNYDSRAVFGENQLSRLFKKYIIKYRGIQTIAEKSSELTDEELGKRIRSYLKIK